MYLENRCGDRVSTMTHSCCTTGDGDGDGDLYEKDYSLGTIDSQFDVFTFSESWLTPMMPDNLLDVEGYSIIRNDRSWTDLPNGAKKKCGVGGADVKYTIKLNTIELSRFNCSSAAIECMWLVIQNPKQRKIIVGEIYRPPNCNLADFAEKIINKVNLILDGSNAAIFILGDSILIINRTIPQKNSHS